MSNRTQKGREDAFWEFVKGQAFGDDAELEELPVDPDPLDDDDDPEWVGKAFAALEEKGLGYVDTDPDPSPKPSARRLRRYWTRGPGAAKIKWGAPGDFNRCVRQLRKYVGPGAEGLCNVYHRTAVGAPPGKGHKAMFDTTAPTFRRAQELLRKAAYEKRGYVPFHGDVESLEALEMRLDTKGVIRRVRTPAGVRHFGQPIGSIIVRDLPMSNLRITEPTHQGRDIVEGTNGRSYDVGKDEDGKWRAYGDGDDDWETVYAEADDQEDLFEILNELAGGKKKPAKKPVAKKPEPKKAPPKKAPAKPTATTKPRSLTIDQIPDLDKAGSSIRHDRHKGSDGKTVVHLNGKPAGARWQSSDKKWHLDLLGEVNTFDSLDDLYEGASRLWTNARDEWRAKNVKTPAKKPVKDLKPGDEGTFVAIATSHRGREQMTRAVGEELGSGWYAPSKDSFTDGHNYYVLPESVRDKIEKIKGARIPARPPVSEMRRRWGTDTGRPVPDGKVRPSDLKPGDYVEGDGLRGRVVSVDGNRVITDGGTMHGPVSRISTAEDRQAERERNNPTLKTPPKPKVEMAENKPETVYEDLPLDPDIEAEIDALSDAEFDEFDRLSAEGMDDRAALDRVKGKRKAPVVRKAPPKVPVSKAPDKPVNAPEPKRPKLTAQQMRDLSTVSERNMAKYWSLRAQKVRHLDALDQVGGDSKNRPGAGRVLDPNLPKAGDRVKITNDYRGSSAGFTGEVIKVTNGRNGQPDFYTIRRGGEVRAVPVENVEKVKDHDPYVKIERDEVGGRKRTTYTLPNGDVYVSEGDPVKGKEKWKKNGKNYAAFDALTEIGRAQRSDTTSSAPKVPITGTWAKYPDLFEERELNSGRPMMRTLGTADELRPKIDFETLPEADLQEMLKGGVLWNDTFRTALHAEAARRRRERQDRQDTPRSGHNLTVNSLSTSQRRRYDNLEPSAMARFRRRLSAGDSIERAFDNARLGHPNQFAIRDGDMQGMSKVQRGHYLGAMEVINDALGYDYSNENDMRRKDIIGRALEASYVIADFDDNELPWAKRGAIVSAVRNLLSEHNAKLTPRRPGERQTIMKLGAWGGSGK